ncbi:MAG: hypothetical protein R3E10_13520 [Gemmatimonadota bacterium]
MLRPLVASVLLLAPLASPSAAQLTTPSEWRWRTDRPARLVDEIAEPSGEWFFVGMPPGWHVTMGPGGVLYNPEYTARGRFEIRSEMILFAESGESGFGIMFGGSSLEGGQPSYMSFLIRRDGSWALMHTLGQELHTIHEWERNEAIAPLRSEGTVSNTLALEVTASEMIFRVNDVELGRLDKSPATTEGSFGFRVGAGLNMHITTLDLTARLAAARGERTSN